MSSSDMDKHWNIAANICIRFPDGRRDEVVLEKSSRGFQRLRNEVRDHSSDERRALPGYALFHNLCENTVTRWEADELEAVASYLASVAVDARSVLDGGDATSDTEECPKWITTTATLALALKRGSEAGAHAVFW